MACDHIIASVFGQPVRESQWLVASDAFARSSCYFLLNAHRLALPHPGTLAYASTCRECGKDLPVYLYQAEHGRNMARYASDPGISESQYHLNCGSAEHHHCQTIEDPNLHMEPA